MVSIKFNEGHALSSVFPQFPPTGWRAQGNHLFPDLTVACSEETGSQAPDPTVILEVLSPATEKRDRGAKLTIYKTLPSLMEYVLIGS